MSKEMTMAQYAKPRLKSAAHLKAVKGMSIAERVAYSTKKAEKEKKRVATSIKRKSKFKDD